MNQEIANLDLVAMLKLFRQTHPEDAGWVDSMLSLWPPGHRGVCAVCDKSDSILAVGVNLWGVCHTHRRYWSVGTDKSLTEHDSNEEYSRRNAELLRTYQWQSTNGEVVL